MSADLDKLKTRIQALGAKTVDNGCTEAEALAAAAKVAELLDRYTLSLDDVAIARTRCERAIFRPGRNKRIRLDLCIDAIAYFCDSKAWRERDGSGEPAHVFFGLPADIAIALYLAQLVDDTVRSELGRYKTSEAYQRFRYNERALANSSFALGMIESIAAKLVAMKDRRDATHRGDGRDLALVKSSAVETELATQGISLFASTGGSRFVSPDAFDAGIAAGDALPIRTNPGG